MLATSDKIYHRKESGAGLYYLISSSFSHQNNGDKSSKVIHRFARKADDCSFQLAAPSGMKKSNAVGLVPDKNSWIVKCIINRDSITKVDRETILDVDLVTEICWVNKY